MPVQIKNNSVGFLSADISASATSLVLSTGTGATFPTLAAGEYFFATISTTAGALEVVKVTARFSDTLTIVRAQESTTAIAFMAGARVELRVSAQAVIDAIDDRVSAISPSLAAAYLQKANNLSDVQSAATARANLGLGAVATFAETAVVNSYATIAAMRAGGAVRSGVTVHLPGYYASGDGGGGEFYGVTGAAPGTYVDNGGTIIVPTGGNGSSAWLSTVTDVVSATQFGAKGDGVTDDTTAIQKAVAWVLANPEMTLWFEEKTYKIGSTALNGETLFLIAGGTSFTMRGRPTFRAVNTNAVGYNVFHLQMGDVDIEYLAVTGDTWTVANVSAAIAVGATALYIQNPTVGTTISNFNFGEVVAVNCSRTVLFDANDKTFGLSADAYIGAIRSTDSCYSLNCANSPNNLVCNQLICDNIFRGYFAYGVLNHSVNVQVKATYSGLFAGGTCANIAVYTESTPGGRAIRTADTKNIHMRLDNLSARPSLQLTTQTQAITDNSTGMYNIFADIFSTSGNPLKVVNTVDPTTVPDTTSVYDSPKQNIHIRAANGSAAALSSSDYGLFNTTNCKALVFEAGNFLDSALAARQSMLTSGWTIYDATYGVIAPKRLAVSKAGSSAYLNVALNEDPHLSLGDDASSQTRIRAGSQVNFYIGGVFNGQWNVNGAAPKADNQQFLGLSAQRWQAAYVVTLYPGAGTVKWTSGSGSPNGSVTAVVGSLYTDTAGGAGTTLYVKESGTGNTGWVAK